MKFTTVAIGALSAAVASAQGPPEISPLRAGASLYYNSTLLDQTNPDDYRCLTTSEFNSRIPECVRPCQIRANREDRCAYDDYKCHCQNYNEYSSIIETCVFPPEIREGGEGACEVSDLGQLLPLVDQMCNFFNATGYSAYENCDKCKEYPINLSPLVTLEILSETVVTVED